VRRIILVALRPLGNDVVHTLDGAPGTPPPRPNLDPGNLVIAVSRRDKRMSLYGSLLPCPTVQSGSRLMAFIVDMPSVYGARRRGAAGLGEPHAWFLVAVAQRPASMTMIGKRSSE
jgi:hypothetical protein